MLSQSLINLVDAAMVGRLGQEALAAVGVGSYASFIVVSTVMGLSSGVQALVARRFGANEPSRVANTFLAGLTLALIMGIPLTALFVSTSDWFIPWFNHDSDVSDIAIAYFDWRTLAATFVALNFVYRGYWSGIGESRIYLYVLLLMHVANVGISYVLIFGLGPIDGLGAVGSGIGTAASMAIGSVIYTWLTFRRLPLRWPPWPDVMTLARLAVPNSTQQTLFALGTSVMFWIIGQIGTQQQAVGHILISLALVLILPAVGLGIASASLVGQALGRQQPQDAYRWGWEVVRLAMAMMATVGLPLWLFPEAIMRLFTPDPELIDLGSWPLRISGLAIVIEVVAMVLTQALLGAGASRQVLKINMVMQWLVLLPLAYLMGPLAGFGLLGIWLLQVSHRVLLSIIYAVIWRSQHWATLRI
ncbi:MATE family efflux transporter [Bacterioplanes sanyensis]|uniref:Multidrug-efflux transporter n=2 Tax=Bacterioplanes sanyensis TaxID=1249553 RepID=A0A222FPK3_9GAMM|nr:MATE family efflux transporter [Bacterioplanes sanyensis]